MSIIALQLHEPAEGIVRHCWDLLARERGISGIRRVPFPHVTLVGCHGIEAPLLQGVLEDLSNRAKPLHLRANGLGLFLEPEPVIYLPVVRSPALAELHQYLWESISSLEGEMFPLYAPERWLPHITLAQFDLQRDSLPEAMRTILKLDPHLEFEARNLTLFDWIGPRYEPRERYALHTQAFNEGRY